MLISILQQPLMPLEVRSGPRVRVEVGVGEVIKGSFWVVGCREGAGSVDEIK